MISFSLSLKDADFERLYAINEMRRRSASCVEDLAQDLLEERIHELFPPMPRFGADGRVLNTEGYRG